LLRSAGRTVVISEKGDPTGGAASTSLLRTFRFAG
jgi:phytoene dehydrogenase-like protein